MVYVTKKCYFSEFYRLDANDYGYASSLNYNIPTIEQSYSLTMANKKRSNVTFTVINSFNYFFVTGRSDNTTVYK